MILTRILWIPHTPWLNRTAQRAKHLIENLRDRHAIHVLTWSEPQSPSPLDFAGPLTHMKAAVPWEREEDGIFLHHISRLTLHRFPRVWSFNQRILGDVVRSLVQKWGIEVLIFSQSAYLIGYPPADTGAVLVFDYVDYTDERVLGEYLRRAEKIVCASQALQRQVEDLGFEAAYVPNGVDYAHLRSADGRRVRTRYGLDSKPVISLIGLTCSPDLYFADSLTDVKETIPDATFMFVGEGAMYRPLRRALRRIREACIWTGWVRPDEVYDYFLATDIGLYPGADDTYFRSACPIKVLEHSAAGSAVVSSPVEEVNHMDLRNVLQVEANSRAFHDGILAAHSLRNPPKGRPPDWKDLAERFEKHLSV